MKKSMMKLKNAQLRKGDGKLIVLILTPSRFYSPFWISI